MSWQYDRSVSELPADSRWTRHLFYRSERTRTTWKLRLGVLVFAAAVLWLGRGWWTAAIARSLVCEPTLAPSDAILIENLEPNYLLFERAKQLRRAGLADRVLVPVFTDRDGKEPNDVALGTAELIARLSRLGAIEILPVREAEPITATVADQVREFLVRKRIRSVIVVTALFRSRRSILVYESALRDTGIAVRCQPVQGYRGVNNWTVSWHGMQEVTEQWLKLQYYRWGVLPIGY